MKKIITVVLMSTALLTGTFAYSSNGKPGTPVSREIAITSSFQRIKVSSDLQLILVQDPNKSSIVINGDESSVKGVKVSFDKGLLSITAKKDWKNKQIKIYVPVTTLSTLELGSNASVTTEGMVMLDNLKVFVDDGSKVMLRILGTFEIEGSEGCDVVYERYEKSNVVFVNR